MYMEEKGGPWFRIRFYSHLTFSSDSLVIIGAGMSGITCAYHLSQLAPDMKITVLEARGICEGGKLHGALVLTMGYALVGDVLIINESIDCRRDTSAGASHLVAHHILNNTATGRNGGHLTPWTYRGFTKQARRFRLDRWAAKLKFEFECAAAIRALIHKNQWEDSVELSSGGNLHVFFSESEAKEAAEELKIMQDYGLYGGDWMDGDLTSQVGSALLHCVIFDRPSTPSLDGTLVVGNQKMFRVHIQWTGRSLLAC